MSELILELKGIEYHYSSASLSLRGIDLRLQRGRNYAVLGANGAGKTTLLLQLNGTLRPCRGEILLNQEPVVYSRSGLLKWRQQVGIVFQNPDDQLFAGTVFQDVSFGPYNLGLPAEEIRGRVLAALQALGIGDLFDRPTHMLSFGQKKRVAIAGAISMHPALLLLDEPTAGLDPLGSEQLLAILRELGAKGVTFILSTHDVDLAYGWADEVIVLREGAILGQGEPDQVLSDRDILAAGSLRMPWVLDMAQALMAKGILPEKGKMPRTRDDLVGLIGSLQDLSDSAF